VSPRLLSTAATLLIALGAVPARAQTAGAPIDSASAEEKVSASDAFERGMQAYKETRFGDALEAFEASYGIVASPNSLLMIGKTLMALKKRPEAHDVLRRAAEEAKEAAKSDRKYGDTAAAAEEDIRALGDTIGFVNLVGTRKVAPEGAELRVGGRTIDPSHWDEPVAANPGLVRVELTGVQTREVEVTAGRESTVDFEKSVAQLKAEEEARLAAEAEANAGADLLAGGIITLGIGVAGMAVFGAFGGLALTKKSELDDACVEMRCPQDLSNAAEEGKAFQLTANIALGIGVAGLVAGTGLIVWHFVDDGDGGVEEARVSLGPGSLSLSGRFR
jgi:hypothetical protein